MKAARLTPLWPLLAAIATVFLLCPATLAQEEEGATTWNLRVNVEAGEAVLVERKVEGKGEITVLQGERASKVKMKWNDRYSFVDRFTVVDDEQKCYESTRRWVKSTSSFNGQPSDSCFNGLEVQYTQEDGAISVQLGGDRIVTRKLLERLQGEGECVGPWIALPDRASIGDTFPVHIDSLLKTFTSATGGVTVSGAEFTFARLEQEGKIACLTAELSWTEVEEKDGGTSRMESRADAELHVDLEGHRLAAFHLKGVLTGEGPGPGDLDMKVTFDFEGELTTKVGQAAEKALKARPVFRTTPRSVNEVGVEFDLPSSWIDRETDAEQSLFLRTLPPTEVNIIVEALEIGDFPVKDVMRATEQELEKQGLKVKAKSAKSKLGKGFSVRLEDDEGEVIHTAYFQVEGSRWVVFKLVGGPEGFKAAFKEYEKAMKSLRKG